MMAKSLEDEGDEAEVIEAAGLDKAHVFWFPVKWRVDVADVYARAAVNSR